MKKKPIFSMPNPEFGQKLGLEEACTDFRVKIGQNRSDKNREIFGVWARCTFRVLPYLNGVYLNY